MRSLWTPRSIYLYIVCLITLIMMIVGTVNIIKAVTELVYPQPRPYATTIVAPGKDELSVETLAEQQAIDREWSRRNAVLSIVGGIALVVIAGPLYAYHWRQIQREREVP